MELLEACCQGAWLSQEDGVLLVYQHDGWSVLQTFLMGLLFFLSYLPFW